MNVGIVTTWHEGGAGYVSRAYMDALKEQGHEVWIYARGGRYYPISDPIWDLPNVTWSKRYTPIARISSLNGQYVNMLHFERWLREHHVEVIITNEDVRADAAKRPKQLGYVVGSYIDYYTTETHGRFKEYDFLLCNTQRHYSAFRDFGNALYVPWGTDVSLFKPRPRKHNKSNQDEMVFFHSANYGGQNCRKGTDLLLEAFQKVTGNTRLVIHSQIPLSEFGDAAAELVRHDARIEFIEKTVPAPGLYHLGDVFVYPSRLEGIGLCIAEALACGLPVITTDNGPMNEFVKDDVNGLLVRVKETRQREDNYYWPESIVDVDDLVKKMQLYVDDRSVFDKHKSRARSYAEEHLDWSKNASSLGDQLEDLVNRSVRSTRRLLLSERLAWGCEAMYVAFHTHFRRIVNDVLRRS